MAANVLCLIFISFRDKFTMFLKDKPYSFKLPVLCIVKHLQCLLLKQVRPIFHVRYINQVPSSPFLSRNPVSVEMTWRYKRRQEELERL